jgi:hypothetical protein
VWSLLLHQQNCTLYWLSEVNLVLNYISTRLQSVILPLYALYPLCKMLCEVQCPSGRCGGERNLAEMEPQILGLPAHNLVAIATELFRQPIRTNVGTYFPAHEEPESWGEAVTLSCILIACYLNRQTSSPFLSTSVSGQTLLWYQPQKSMVSK